MAAPNALSFRQIIVEENIALPEQPHYAPDLTPCDLLLLPMIKGSIKGTRLEGDEASERAVTTELRGISSAEKGGRERWKSELDSW